MQRYEKTTFVVVLGESALEFDTPDAAMAYLAGRQDVTNWRLVVQPDASTAPGE